MGQKTRYKLVDELPANEFYMLEGRQFSKSDGWTIDLDDFFNKYSVDQIRYMIAASAPENQDSEFTWKEFQTRCNAELLGKLGNFVHRVLTFAMQNLHGVVPSNLELSSQDQSTLDQMRMFAQEASQAYENFSLRKATALLIDMAQAGNVYFDHTKPWVLKKDPQLHKQLESVIYTCLESIRLMALVAMPIIPDSASKILELLGLKSGIDCSWDKFVSHHLVPGQKLQTPQILFRKIEDEEIAQEVAKLKTMSANVSTEPLISFEEFKKLDIAIAEVIQAESIAGSDKLFKLQVNDGSTKRQIVAGLKEVISAEQLIGKQVLILRNLEKATIRGVESQGMVLALKEGKHLKALTLEGFKLGAKLA